MTNINMKTIVTIFTLMMGSILGGCAGGGGGGTSPGSAPVVVITSPARDATGVLLTKPIAVAFSKAMKADTFTATSFTAKASSGSVVTGTISYANDFAILTPSPSALLLPSTLYTVTLSGVQSADGGTLASDYSWSFTTGPLDPGFGNGGVVITPVSLSLADGARAVAVQPADGKVVAVGYVDSGSGNYDFAVARYNTNGSLDTTFSVDGIVTTAISANPDEARAVAIQSDGKIVVVGVTSTTATGTDFVVARYNSDGTLDTSFNTNGFIINDFGTLTNNEAFAVAIQSIGPNVGKIVVVGQSGPLTDTEFALARYNTNGTLDATFGASGLQITPFGIGVDAAYAVALQSDDKIVVAGLTDSISGPGVNNDFALARYEVNGILDTTFGIAGKVKTAVGTADEGAFAVGIQSTGKIVAAGAVLNTASNNNDFGLVRYNGNGSLDITFGAASLVPGTVLTDMAGSNDVALAMMIEADNKIMVGGAAFVTGQGNDLALARYTPDGAADVGFDVDGKVVTNVSAAHDTAYGLALRPGGKVVLAGSTGTGAATNFLLVGFVAPVAP